MIVELTDAPEVEICTAQRLDSDKLYLLSIPRETPPALAEELARYLRKLDVHAIVLALGDMKLYEVQPQPKPALTPDEITQYGR